METLVTVMALNSTGIRQWVLSNIVPLILLFVGILIMAKSKKRDWAGSLDMGGIVVFGLVFVLAAAAIVTFGGEIASLIFT